MSARVKVNEIFNPCVSRLLSASTRLARRDSPLEGEDSGESPILISTTHDKFANAAPLSLSGKATTTDLNDAI